LGSKHLGQLRRVETRLASDFSCHLSGLCPHYKNVGWIRHVAILLTLLASVTPAFAQRGVPNTGGFPSWEERMLLVYVNRARADPAADLAGCGSNCGEAACYSQVAPVDYALGLNRSARFHSANLQAAGAFQHDSPCTLVTDIATKYIPTGTCTGAASCACQGGTFTGATTWSTRIGYFYSNGTLGENIAAGNSTPSATFYQWLWEASASSTCGFSSSDGHRWNILNGGYGVMGNGHASNWTQDWAGGAAPSAGLIAGGHEPQFISSAVDFRVNYYNTAGAPTAHTVNVDGTCTTVALERGTATNATYHLATTLSNSTCHKYRFEFTLPGGATAYLPSTGSYLVGGSSCADYTATTVNACGTPPDNPPTVATAAKATPSPVTGTTTALSVLGADDGGEPALVYTWSSTGPASVMYSANGTNGAKNTTVTFAKAGSYTFTATIKDGANQTVTSAVAVTVSQTATTLSVAPSSASVPAGTTQQFTSTMYDQFAAALASQPAATWTVAGGGSISASGLFTAGSTASGPYTVTASANSKMGTASVTVTGPLAPTIATAANASPKPVTGTTTTATVLGASGGGESALTYTWTGSGPAPIAASPNGTNGAKSSTITFATAGTYTLTATVTDGSNQTATSSVMVQVDATPSTVAVTPPTAVVVVANEQDFTAAIADQFGHAAGVMPVWSVSGGGVVDANGHFTAGAVVGGPYTLTASGGGVMGTATIAIVDHADTTPPSVAITSPVDGSAIDGATTVTVDAQDDVGVASVAYSAGGQQLVVTASPWSVTWDPSSLPEGTYTITAVATDLAGNQSAPATVTVTFGSPTGGGNNGGGSHGGCDAGGSGGSLTLALTLTVIRRRRRNR